jgi:hypothetical protein
MSLDQHDMKKLEDCGPLVALACKLTGEKGRSLDTSSLFCSGCGPLHQAAEKRETDEDFH